MPWIRLDDSFSDHPKVAEAGPLASWLHVKAMIYCGRHLTDGRISRAVVVSLVDWASFGVTVDVASHAIGGTCDTPNNFDLADSLVSVGLWKVDGTAYVIHDYLKYQPSREQALAEREANRKRVERHRSKDGTFGNGITNGVGNGSVTTAPIPSRTRPVSTEETHTAAAPLELVPVSAEQSFDFVSVYNAYPRKEGRTKGIARLRSQVRTPEAFEQLKRAIGHYAEKVRAEGTDAQFVPHFSTWANGSWRDYVDGSHIVERKPVSATGAVRLDPPRKKYQDADEYAAKQRAKYEAGE